MTIPTKQECLRILKENSVPDNVIAHVRAVHDFSMKVVDLLEKRGISVNRSLVAAAALLHDIKKVGSERHEIEGAELIKSLGFPEVAGIVSKHGLSNLKNPDLVPKTLEEKIVFYSDKRVTKDRVVTVDERFDYIRERYKKGDIEHELIFTKNIEKELLGEAKL